MSETYDPQDMINTKQAAALAKVHPRTIVAWVKRGWLPAMKRPGSRGRYLIRAGDLQDVAYRRYEHD